MTSAKRRLRRTYIGAPWTRGMSSLSTTKQERTKKSKDETERVTLVLPLVVKPDGTWAYKFGSMYPARRS